MNEGLYYKQSGKWSLSGPPVGLVIGMVAGAPLAFVYSYVMLYIWYIPFIRYLALAAPAAFGAFIGLITAQGLAWRKCPNVALAKGVAFLVALATLYSSWAVWVYAVVHRIDARFTLLPLFLRPDILWLAIRKINEVGTWQYSGLRPSGIVLWAWWLAEALMIVAAAVFLAGISIASDVFCESCDAWCKKAEVACKLSAGDPAEFKQRMESKDFGYLEKLGAAEPGATAWATLDIHSCPTCRATNTLTVSSKKISVDKQGKKTVLTDRLIDKLLISSSEADTIRQIGQKLTTSPASS